MPRRRHLLAAVCGVLLLPRTATSQQPGRTYRVGWIGGSLKRSDPYEIAFVERLRELGFVEGRNLAIEYRTTLGRPEKLPVLVDDLARLKCDVLIPGSTEANLAAFMRGTRDTPLVMVFVDFDPVATGHITNLARPGGRVTGVSALQTQLPAKRLEVFRELLPNLKRIGVLADSASAGQLRITQAAAARLGIELLVHQFATSPYEYEPAFATFARGKAQAVVALGSVNFVPARQLIPQLALRHKLPSIFHQAQWVEAGGLLSYGPNFPELFRRAADQVGRVLNGAKPSDLPVEEQSQSVEMVINMNTADKLGLNIPASFRLRAGRLVE